MVVRGTILVQRPLKDKKPIFCIIIIVFNKYKQLGILLLYSNVRFNKARGSLVNDYADAVDFGRLSTQSGTNLATSRYNRKIYIQHQ